MKNTLKIPFSLIDLKTQKVIEVLESFIELHPDYYHYVVRFSAEELVSQDDPKMGSEVINNAFDVYAFKSKISGIEKALCIEGEWKITIAVTGFSEDTRIFFKKEKKAQYIFSIIQEWVFNNDFPYEKYNEELNNKNQS